MVVRRSLGVDVCDKAEELECASCKERMDRKGDHECPKDGAWVKAHNALRDVYYEVAREGLVECQREKQVTFSSECLHCHEILIKEEEKKAHKCSKRKDKKNNENKENQLEEVTRITNPTYTADLIFERGIPGLTVKKTLVDFTIKHELLPTYAHEESLKLGAAAHEGEKEKERKYKERTEKIDQSFLAVAFNSFGYVRPNGESLAYYLIEQRAHQKGMTFNESASLFWHTLSVKSHQAHARSILTRLREVIYNIRKTH